MMWLAKLHIAQVFGKASFMGNTLLSAVVFVDGYFLDLFWCYQALAENTKPSRLFSILSHFWHLANQILQVFQLFLEALECFTCLFQLCSCEFSNPGLDEFWVKYFNSFATW